MNPAKILYLKQKNLTELLALAAVNRPPSHVDICDVYQWMDIRDVYQWMGVRSLYHSFLSQTKIPKTTN